MGSEMCIRDSIQTNDFQRFGSMNAKIFFTKFSEFEPNVKISDCERIYALKIGNNFNKYISMINIFLSNKIIGITYI